VRCLFLFDFVFKSLTLTHLVAFVELKSAVADLVTTADAKAKRIATQLKALQSENEAFQSEASRTCVCLICGLHSNS
jgi:hypothetical protein